MKENTSKFLCSNCGQSVLDDKNGRYYHKGGKCKKIKQKKSAEKTLHTPKWKWGKVKCQKCPAVHGSSKKSLSKHSAICSGKENHQTREIVGKN